MPARERRRDRAMAAAERIEASAASEIRLARRTAGLSIRDAAMSVGMHPSTFRRVERNALPSPTVEQLAVGAAAVGLGLSLKTFPLGDAARDAGQLRLLERLRSRLPGGIGWRTEVPLPIAGDLRAIDAVIELPGAWIAVEAESRLFDLQAIERRAVLKKRDAGPARLILLVASTAANRAVLRVHREALRGSFPCDTRETLAALARSEAPHGDAVVVL